MIESPKKAYMLSELLLGKKKIEEKLLKDNLSLDKRKKLEGDLYLLDLKITNVEKQVRAQFAWFCRAYRAVQKNRPLSFIEIQN